MDTVCLLSAAFIYDYIISRSDSATRCGSIPCEYLDMVSSKIKWQATRDTAENELPHAFLANSLDFIAPDWLYILDGTCLHHLHKYGSSVGRIPQIQSMRLEQLKRFES